MMSSDSDSDYEEALGDHDYFDYIQPDNEQQANNQQEQQVDEQLQQEPLQLLPADVEVLLINGVRAAVDSDSDTGHEDTDSDQEDGEDRGNESDRNELLEDDLANLPAFDPELPMRHSYLGEGMEELHGRRAVLEDEMIPAEIPLLGMSLHLVPGQTLPLTIFHSVFQNAIRRCVTTNERVFGIVNSTDMDVPTRSAVPRGALGTLAEIYEFHDESDEPPAAANLRMSSSFAIKAKGRHRFNVIEVRRQADGNLMGKVKIRPEIRLQSLANELIFNNTCRYRFAIKSEKDNIPSKRLKLTNSTEETDDMMMIDSTDSPLLPKEEKSKRKKERDERKKIRKQTSSITSTTSADSTDSSSSITEQAADKDPIVQKLKKMNQTKREITKYHSAFTPWPYFVYENYEESMLVERVHRIIRNDLKGLTMIGTNIPTDATELSFWLAQNLTVDDSVRQTILQMDSPVQRLRYELDLLHKASTTIVCRRCQNVIAPQSEIFSMSIEGPQGTYVNPDGFVHETLTVSKVKGVVARGSSSTVASWFPGYAWTIIQCSRCEHHIGWKFRAVGRLKPRKFWGLTRKSVNFKYEFDLGPYNLDNPSENRTQAQEQQQIPISAMLMRFGDFMY